MGERAVLKRGDKNDAVRDLQDLLNRCGFRMSVDGIFGNLTEVLVKQAQKKAGLAQDGIVGPKTWAAMETMANPSPGVSVIGFVRIKPETMPGLYSYSGPNSGPDERSKWGLSRTEDALREAGAKIQAAGLEAGVGDISLKDGGPFTSLLKPGDLVHQTHRNGRNVDIRPIRKDRKRLPVSTGLSGYDREATEIILREFRKSGAIEIYFNDAELIQRYPYVRRVSGHDNHLHLVYA